jgi:hypothetical protein
MADWTLIIFWKCSSTILRRKKRLQSDEEMELKFRIGFSYVIPERKWRYYHRSTEYQRFHTGACECMAVCCCNATACHQGYFLQLMKHLMMLMWLVGTHSSSNSITALCRFPGLVRTGRSKAKMTYWCVSISIFLFVALYMVAAVINLFVRLHHQGM